MNYNQTEPVVLTSADSGLLLVKIINSQDLCLNQ